MSKRIMIIDSMMDITAPEAGVEVVIRKDSKVLWVNVDGECVLRICQIPEFELVDSRKYNL